MKRIVFLIKAFFFIRKYKYWFIYGTNDFKLMEELKRLTKGRGEFL